MRLSVRDIWLLFLMFASDISKQRKHARLNNKSLYALKRSGRQFLRDKKKKLIDSLTGKCYYRECAIVVNSKMVQ